MTWYLLPRQKKVSDKSFPPAYVSSQLLDNFCNHTFSKLYLLLAQGVQSSPFHLQYIQSMEGDNTSCYFR